MRLRLSRAPVCVNGGVWGLRGQLQPRWWRAGGREQKDRGFPQRELRRVVLIPSAENAAWCKGKKGNNFLKPFQFYNLYFPGCFFLFCPWCLLWRYEPRSGL